MKALLISSSYFPPQVGGISRAMLGLAAALGPQHVAVLTGRRAGGECRRGVIDGVHVYRRPALFAGVKGWRAVPFALAVAEVMVRERPRVAIVSTAGDGYLGLWLRRRFGLPFVIFAHGNEVLHAMQSTWDKPLLSLQQADRVFAVSQFTAGLLAERGVDPGRIVVTHLGCDFDHFRPVPRRSDLGRTLLGNRFGTNVILTVGNLEERKGHDMVIRALPLVRERVGEVTYLILGSGPDRPRLERLGREVRLEGCVVFAGNVPDADLPAVYELCDVFAMVSRERLDACDVEGLGLVFLEASACMKPVVGGRSGGVPEAIEHGVTGLLVNPHDPAEVADAISEILVNRSAARCMGERGRERVISQFAWPSIRNRVLETLELVIQEKRPHA